MGVLVQQDRASNQSGGLALPLRLERRGITPVKSSREIEVLPLQLNQVFSSTSEKNGSASPSDHGTEEVLFMTPSRPLFVAAARYVSSSWT